MAVAGDVQKPGLGLADDHSDELAAQVSNVVHSAASVSFSLPLDESRSINVEGTRNVLEFAARCRDQGGLRRLCYVSTAYVAGTHPGEFGEDDLTSGRSFRNAYEQSKFEAEQLVRSDPRPAASPDRAPEHRRGRAPERLDRVLQRPLRAAQGVRARPPARPARRDRKASVDVVPVDYVADAIFELSSGSGDDDNRTYHLVAGPHATTVERLIGLSARRLGRRPPLLLPPDLYRRLLHPLLMRRSSDRRRRALRQMEVFFPYFSMRVRLPQRANATAAGPRADRAGRRGELLRPPDGLRSARPLGARGDHAGGGASVQSPECSLSTHVTELLRFEQRSRLPPEPVLGGA